jgi:deoxycytidine triphosphate deaminase
LIHPFDSENLRGSSYDLTIGEEYYIGQDFNGTKLSTEKLEQAQVFWIPPHAVCFILSAEILSLPKDISAKVSLRMAYIYAGLVLTSQPPFDPGYSGRAIVMLHNLSSESISMRRGERLATIEFVKLTSATSLNKVHRSVETIGGQITRPLTSSLSEIASQSAAARKQVQFLTGQIVVFAALIVAVLAVPGFFSFTGILDRINEQKAELSEQKKQIQEYKEALDAMKLRLNQQATSSKATSAEHASSSSEGKR